MRRKHVSMEDAVAQIAEHLRDVAERGDSYLVQVGSRPVAELRPFPRGFGLGDLAELLGSGRRLAADDARDFSRDLGSIRREANGVCRNHWSDDCL